MQPPLSPPVVPPLSEDFFISDAIDFNLEHNPNQPCYTYADPQKTNGIGVITHLEFGRAAHRAAHALRPNGSGPDRQVVALIALSDTIFYQAIVAGLIVAGHVPFPISPRNTPAAIVNLIEKSSCHRLLTTHITLDPLIQGIKSLIAGTPLAESLQIEEVPSFQTVYPHLAHETSEHLFERYPPINRPSRDDFCIYIHSSGSTGLPKAIAQTNRAWVHWAMFPPTIDMRNHKTRLVLACMPLPAFHTFGLYLQIINTVYGVITAALYPPTATSPELLPVTPSPQNILEHSKKTKANGMIITPSILQVWAQSPEIIEYLKELELVAYAGGSLAPKLGYHLIDSGVKLRNLYGTTEIGSPTKIFPLEGDEREWEYMSFSDRANIRWVSQGDGTFECQFLDWEKHTPMDSNLDDVRGYATSDLFENHPTKSYLWKIVGRKDDVIVFASGEKAVPTPVEDVIMSSPLVQAAVMFGRERSQAGILVEPRNGKEINVDDEDQVSNFKNDLWPIVQEANKAAPAFSRIFKEMILVSSRDKPLPRAGKGTVMRKAAIDFYAKEINALYDRVESSTASTGNVTIPASWSPNDVEKWITEQANDLMPSKVNISPTQDLFEQGFDSLSASFLGRRIVDLVRVSGIPKAQKAVAQMLPQTLIYTYPTIANLALHIFSEPTSMATNAASGGKHLIEELIKKYTAGFKALSEADNTSWCARSSSPVVLLTGSTGNLGSDILAALLEDDRVERIYALNRPANHRTLFERHSMRFQDRGLDINLLNNEKLVLLSGDTGQPGFGLDRGQYSELHRSVNVVIHNAWKLDFNLSLSSFESHIRGTRHLIDFIQSGPNSSNSRFVFLSSVTSAQSWDKSRGPIPEEIVTDASCAVGGGYGESKYVAERVLAQSGLRSTSIRIGQISGGLPNGAWATTGWVPILVKSSITLGILPGVNESSHVSWLPMDKVAGSVVNVALSSDVVPPTTLNLVHPRPIKWGELITIIQSTIKAVLGRDLSLVTFDKWTSTLDARANDATLETLEAIPAVKLLDFFRPLGRKDELNGVQNSIETNAEIGGLATFSTKKMLTATGDLMDARKLSQISNEDVTRWIKYWQAAGFLN